MAFDKILLVDDSLIIRKTLETHLRKKQFSVATASSLSEAERLLGRCIFDLVFIEIELPDGDGTQLLERFTADLEGPLPIVITSNGSIESAVRCMQLGALDYVIKPCSLEQIDEVLGKVRKVGLESRNRAGSNGGGNRDGEIIGRSMAMRKIRKMIKKVAATEATVLISGENGTGKEVVASELHRLSPLAEQAYVRVNCAAISETLIESEFFGHEKGSFTGAIQRRLGRFELAHNGTILLDEIGEISPCIQVKLLRVLQEQEFERVGGNRSLRVSVRVLATTNRDLKKAVEKGEFREDLYYRLNVFPITVPPLRERKEDIVLLADDFLGRYSKKHGVRIDGFSRRAADLMMNHDWPGNVRELQNSIERAVILTENGKLIQDHVLGLHHSGRSSSSLLSPVPVHLQGEESRGSLGASRDDFVIVSNNTEVPGNRIKSLDQLEKEHIFRVLSTTEGNRTRAASILKITIRTLRNKLNQYRLEGDSVF